VNLPSNLGGVSIAVGDTLEERVQAIRAPNGSVTTSNFSIGLRLEKNVTRVKNKGSIATSANQGLSVQSQSVVLPNKAS
jgi:hypothetical protein